LDNVSLAIIFFEKSSNNLRQKGFNSDPLMPRYVGELGLMSGGQMKFHGSSVAPRYKL
jgi:hypothetical protein